MAFSPDGPVIDPVALDFAIEFAAAGTTGVVLTGTSSNDTPKGGSGADTFVFNDDPPDGDFDDDVIEDFNPAEDTIRIVGVNPGSISVDTSGNATSIA